MDLGKNRILIYGKPLKVISFLKTIIQRFDYDLTNYQEIRPSIKELTTKYFNEPLGTRLLIGGFGVVFTVVIGFLFDKLGTGQTDLGILVSLVLSLLAYVTFIFNAAFEDRIVAVSPLWTNIISIINWIVFIAFLILGAIFFLSDVETVYLVILTQILSLIIIILSLIKTSVEVLFEDGLSKKTLLFLWGFLFVVNAFFTYMILST